MMIEPTFRPLTITLGYFYGVMRFASILGKLVFNKCQLLRMNHRSDDFSYKSLRLMLGISLRFVKCENYLGVTL